MKPDETTSLVNRGFDFYQSKRGNLYFAQPCTALQGSQCSVYNVRPGECQRFRCKLLKKFDSGKIDSVRAGELIGKALAIKASLIKDAHAFDPQSKNESLNLQNYMKSRIGEFRKNRVSVTYCHRNLSAIELIRDTLTFFDKHFWRQPLLKKIKMEAKVTKIGMRQ